MAKKLKHSNRRTFVFAGWIVAGAVLLFTYTNCSSDHGVSADISSFNATAALESLRQQKDSVLVNKCASCHNSTSVSVITDILNTQTLINDGFVNVGSPQTSPLYLDVIDGLMPPAGSPPLTNSEIYILRDWISAEGGNFDTYIGGTPIDPGGGAGSSDFTQVRAVLNQNCTSCHRAGGNLPRLDVDAPTLRGTLYQGQNLVIPNNASGSLLLQSFARMPTGGPLGVNSSAANVIRNWINTGAN